MISCCAHDRSAARFFSRFARRYRRRFERRGPERSQRQLLDGLEAVGYREAELLEIGAGVGYLHQSLLERGAASATGIDLAPAMVEQARARAAEHGLEHRIRYLCGDFVALEAEVPAAEVVILDKVVCCYPDAAVLLAASLDHARRACGLTYPRDRWWVRAGAALTAVVLRLFGSGFRPYVHDPREIERRIGEHGFVCRYQGQTAVWRTQVFERAGVHAA